MAPHAGVADQRRASSLETQRAAGRAPHRSASGVVRRCLSRCTRGSCTADVRRELRAWLCLVWPVAIGLVSRISMPLVDLMFVGRLGVEELAGASVAAVRAHVAWHTASHRVCRGVPTSCSGVHVRCDTRATCRWLARWWACGASSRLLAASSLATATTNACGPTRAAMTPRSCCCVRWVRTVVDVHGGWRTSARRRGGRQHPLFASLRGQEVPPGVCMAPGT